MIFVLFYLNALVFSFIEYLKEDYIFHYLESRKVDQDFLEKKILEYTKQVILWEFLLVLATMLIVYKIIDRMTKQQKEYRDFLELIILTISHKFGNFLASQKGNIEILKINYDPKALHRMEKNYEIMREDFNTIVNCIENFKRFSTYREKIRLREIINKSLNLLTDKKNFQIRGKDLEVYANRQAFDNILFNILENAVKYSEGTISIRITKRYLAIRNKILLTSKGSGIGLKISETLAKKQGFQLLYRTKGEYFLCLLKFR